MTLSGTVSFFRHSAKLRLAIAALLLPVVAACGFQMRGVTPLPFDSLYVGIADTTQFGAEIRRAIRAVSPDTKIVTMPDEAQARLQNLGIERDRREVSLDPQGRVEEYELSLVFHYRLIDQDGRALIPDSVLSATRDMPYDPQIVQAKSGEMATLYREMERSLVDRLVRRLTAPDVREAAQHAAEARSRGEAGDLPLYAPDANDVLKEGDEQMPDWPSSGERSSDDFLP